MKQIHYRLIVSVFAVTVLHIAAGAKTISVTSPDRNVAVTLSDTEGLRFSLSYDGRGLLDSSPLAIAEDNVSAQASIKSSSLKKNIKEKVRAPFHHTPEYEAEWNQLSIVLSNGQTLQWRVFNDGAAYRFVSKLKESSKILDETARFNFVGDPTLYLAHSTNEKNPMAMAFQNFYKVTPASSASPLLAFLPVVADFGDGLKLSLMESDVKGYPGVFVSADSLTSSLNASFARYPGKTDYYPWRKQEYVTETEDFIAKSQDRRIETPWRIFAVTTDDRSMPVNNLVYSLSDPTSLSDISWIKPGKAAWEWWNDWGLRGVPFKAGINNDTYRYFIDFASENGIEYVVLDEGWYDPASGDMLTTIPDIDLPMLAAYAKEKGVGLWLWTVFNVLDDQLEDACKKYSDMGIKGFKVDFLDRNDQTAVEMTYRIAEAAANHKLMLDLHGFYTPSGIQREYPNIVNFESVFGMEEMKWSDPSVDMPEYDVTFPFIRMMTGPVDFTPGAMNNASRADWKAIYSSPMSQGTRCHQIANYIVHDSPFTMLADAPSNYLDNKESTDFIVRIPTVFDSTTILDGKMGEYIVTLRESSDGWYLAGQTDWSPRDYTIDFSFLPEGKSFEVTLLRDGVNADKQARDYVKETLKVDSNTRLPLRMASGGGFAAKITNGSF